VSNLTSTNQSMDPNDLQTSKRLIAKAFPPGALAEDSPAGPVIVAVNDANNGRGVFSHVLRVELTWPGADVGPSSVVVKFPARNRNGEAARRSGACLREAMAYRQLLLAAPIQAPRAYLVDLDDDNGACFVFEDLSHHRAVDQLDGLGVDDAIAVVEELRTLHQHGRHRDDLARFDLRRDTPSVFTSETLAAGLSTLEFRWADWVDDRQRLGFQRLVANREALGEAFRQASGATLCHGDPRADNLVFDAAGQPILFDWQQISRQIGEADLAWLAATSLTVETRRNAEQQLVSAYGTSFDQYRLGYLLPGLAVLALAQRQADDERSRRFITTSLQRIGSALDDLKIGH